MQVTRVHVELSGDALMTLREAAACLRMSRSSLLRLIKTGKLSSGLVGGKRLVTRASVSAYLADQFERTAIRA